MAVEGEGEDVFSYTRHRMDLLDYGNRLVEHHKIAINHFMYNIIDIILI